MSFSDLKQKDVINLCDGKRLGKPIDLILTDDACVEALVVPGDSKGLMCFLKQEREGFAVPWRRVRRIGDDVILVEVDSESPGWEIK